MNEKQTVHISKFLSLVLRHKPETIGIALDENGWASTKELIEKMSASGTELNFETLAHVVETNPKKRFAFNEDRSRIRASQGHSLEIELGYAPKTPPEILYHGTAVDNLDSIRENGLQKQSRHHVHLSADKETAQKVGMRHGKPVVLEVLSGEMQRSGVVFYRSENGVWLTDFVGVGFIRF